MGIERTSAGGGAGSVPSIGAVVVTFYPDLEFQERIEALCAQVDRVVIVDNATPSEQLAAVEQIVRTRTVKLIRNQENLGIAAALNQGVEWLARQSVEWALTLDQDSRVAPGFIAAMMACLAAPNCRVTADVAIVGAGGRLDRGSSRQISWLRPRFGGLWFERVQCDAVDERGVSQVITSGSLTNISIWRQLGGYREDLFIDLVDFEYCLRARQADFRVLVCCAAQYSHQVGEASRERILGWSLTPTHHSALRRYYLARNATLLMRMHGRQFPYWVLYQLLALGEVFVGILLFETEKWPKLRAISIGVLHGWRGVMGRAKRPF